MEQGRREAGEREQVEEGEEEEAAAEAVWAVLRRGRVEAACVRAADRRLRTLSDSPVIRSNVRSVAPS